ncbi:RidA family protein [Herbaspirillum lusitanum]|uniref:RidA family protein n=1 Tax=Herbaspirillum lusitanum TaxID=213312 RepID=A0ABW9AF30_9BURK
MNLEQRLIDLSITLPAAAAPGANYAAGVMHRDVVWISGQLPRDGDRVLVSGKLGKEVSIAEAQGAARAALLRALAALRDTAGDLRRVRQIVKLTMYVNCSEDFSEHSAVADGASDLIYELFGPELGRHARTSVGVAQLPRNACLELDIVATLEE